MTDPVRAIHSYFGKEGGAETFFVKLDRVPSASPVEGSAARGFRLARQVHKNALLTRQGT